MVFALACVGMFCYLARLGGEMQTLDVAGPDPAAVAQTAKEIAAINAESAALQAAVDKRLASWYGLEFQGKATASTQPYDRWGCTCANRFLPVGTPVKVTNLANRRWIILIVTDRGPYHKNQKGEYDRDIDLSEWAAYQLGIRERGVAEVQIKVLEVSDGAR
jgi:rare lipoprotein A (peptidoglycan hydrolase)